MKTGNELEVGTISDKEIIFHFDALVSSQTEYLWTAALTSTTLAALLLAFFIRKFIWSRQEVISIFIFSIAIVLMLISLIFGYLVKGALIVSIQDFVYLEEWKVRPAVEGFNLFQSLSFFVGFGFFILAILISAKTSAKAAKSIGGTQ